jgi:S-DNA-T family DNA segregation ATPase FtsK/SpoIIIE
MPRRQAKQQNEESSFWNWLFYALVVLIIVVAIVFVPWRNIIDWLSDIALNIWALFFWGLFLVIFAILTPIFLIWRKRFSLFLTYWYRWLGIVALTIAVWGIFAFNGVGGTIGMAIIGGEMDAWGVTRIVLLFILSIMLIFPRAVRALAKRLINAVSEYRARRRQRTATKPIIVRTVARQKEIDFTPSEEVPKERKQAKANIEETSAAIAQRGLKQIAQDVWKKYGQAPGIKVVDGWRLPPIDILDDAGDIEYGQPDNVQRARRIEEALKSYGVDAKVVQINAGPTVTQFGVEPGWDIKTREIRERDKDGNIATHLEEVSRTRVKVERITSLANDLALALAAPSIRIEAPVPGKSVIGIEVPNTVSGVVSLRGVIETSVFQKLTAKSKLAIALGKGAGGEAGAADLAKMPHLLIAGATGSGKTVCLNASICCLLMQNTPDDLRFIMIDPKRVELTMFNSIPHLAVPVIVNAEKALEALRWLELEMDNRYQMLAKAGARNIDGYNKDKRGKEKMYYMVLIIDELADLMMAGYDEVERILCRLAQLARAVGIHLIVATQRPSVDVVTGLIKANFPTRLSFAVTSQVDSRTILDTVGAEKLLGRGDMLYAPTEAAKPKRLQGCYVSDTETERLVYFWGSQKAEVVTEIKIEPVAGASIAGIRTPPKDVLMEQARKLVQEQEQISASFLQRKLQIGYPRAARLKELLDEERAQAIPKQAPSEEESDNEPSDRQ